MDERFLKVFSAYLALKKFEKSLLHSDDKQLFQALQQTTSQELLKIFATDKGFEYGSI